MQLQLGIIFENIIVTGCYSINNMEHTFHFHNRSISTVVSILSYTNYRVAVMSCFRMFRASDLDERCSGTACRLLFN